MVVAGAMMGCMGSDGATSATYSPTANSASARVTTDSVKVPSGVDSTLMLIREKMDSVLTVDRGIIDSIMKSSGMDSIRAAQHEKMDSLLALRKAHRDSVLDTLFHARDSIAARWKMDSTLDTGKVGFMGDMHRMHFPFRR